MRRTQRTRSTEEVRLNLTAMLDMAFQMLAFFILTFRPAPPALGFKLPMPPAQAIASVPCPPAPGKNRNSALIGTDTLVITLLSDHAAIPAGSGRLTKIVVNAGQGVLCSGPQAVELERCLHTLLADDQCPFSQVIVQVDPRMRYADLMTVIGVCRRMTVVDDAHPGHRIPLTKVSFVELSLPEPM